MPYHLRVEFGLRYAYFGNTSTALMDKISFYVDRSIELGGEVRECIMRYMYTIVYIICCISLARHIPVFVTILFLITYMPAGGLQPSSGGPDCCRTHDLL